ncbi:ABC-type lipoprotein export system ATPase subunit [Massilia sp. MP_M2]|uniref:TrlF family AAA-like ATPase n=1 Tax=Massilia sp. MP_M2 TaxID=3071713 RepID=UPI00319DAC12
MVATSRGSLWRVWDFHAHTPASHQWNGAKLEDALSAHDREVIVAATVAAIKVAEPDVVVIMDYWTFDGYFAIKEYAKANPGALGDKVIMPGIEIRMESSHPDQRLNVHFVLDPELKDQSLRDVLSSLKISLKSKERGLSNDCFVEWARELGTDKLSKHSFAPAKVASDDKYALLVGRSTAEVTATSVRAAFDCLPEGTGLVLMPWDTYGGMKDIDWANHYAETRRLMQAEIFECKNVATRECFHGLKTSRNDKFFDSFWESIGKRPRLCVRGTDAHSLSSYGKFPSEMKTWLKAEPTFLGLKQAIKEPATRSFIGDIPPKKALVAANGSLFLDRIQVSKKAGALVHEDWFDGVDIELNSDLVAVIGNKGSGKSGFADILALAGNSKSHKYFTFLHPDRFKAGGTKRAGAFQVRLSWCNGASNTLSLDATDVIGQPERVKYISQRYFEELCNEHVSGRSDRFAQEIKGVLFSKMDPAEKLSFESLDDYLRAQEGSAAERVVQLRVKLKDLNASLVSLDIQQTAEYRNSLDEKLAVKRLAFDDLNSRIPAPVEKPVDATNLNPESVRLEGISNDLMLEDQKIVANESERKKEVERRNALSLAIGRVTFLQKEVDETAQKIGDDLAGVGIVLDQIVVLQTKSKELEVLHGLAVAKIEKLSLEHSGISDRVASLKIQRDSVQELLDGPTKEYHLYMTALETWQAEKAAILGSEESAESLLYYETRIKQLEELPAQREAFEAQRSGICEEIYRELRAVADSRKPLFHPVEKIVADFPAVKEDLRIDFQSSLFFDRTRFIEKFFAMVKQNTGGFKGDPEGAVKLDGMIRAVDIESVEEVVALIDSVCAELTLNGKVSLQQVLRVGVTPQEFYDNLFGLHQLEPKFSLSLAGTTMQQMSPGQRGALLLIFYLLVDNDQTPLVLDQPEDNLDNQTVYSMLVPVIQRAKERRQIILVTHNANLAVCCDAEQIIHAGFDRANRFKLSYTSGAIESSSVNRAVVDVLEGTVPAFINRKEKYIASHADV